MESAVFMLSRLAPMGDDPALTAKVLLEGSAHPLLGSTAETAEGERASA